MRVELTEVNLCADCPDEDTAEGSTSESINWHVETLVEKYDADYTAEQIAKQGIEPVEVVRVSGNLLMKAGAQRLIDQLIGVTTLPFNNANSRLGVGNSATAEVNTHTDLQAVAGAANRQFKVMDATYPSRLNETVTWKSTFAAADAQFAWNEWCIDRGTANGTTVTAPMFNRKVPATSMGTKGAVAWALTVSITPG